MQRERYLPCQGDGVCPHTSCARQFLSLSSSAKVSHLNLGWSNLCGHVSIAGYRIAFELASLQQAWPRLRSLEKLAFFRAIWYDWGMLENLEKELKSREAAHLQALESNPLDAEQMAMFEMFEREGWRYEQRLAYIRDRAEKVATASTAE